MRGIRRALLPLVVAAWLAAPAGAAPKNTTNIYVGGYPLDIAVDPAAHRLYVANWNQAAINVVDTVARAVVGRIELPAAPRAVAIDLTRHRLYAPMSPLSAVATIDIEADANRLLGTVGVGANPWDASVDEGAQRLYVANAGSNSVSIVDTTGDTNSVVKSVAVGGGPRSLGVNPVTKRLFVANYGAKTVSVIDTAGDAGTLVKTFTLCCRPNGIAVDPIHNHAWVGLVDSSYAVDIDGGNLDASPPSLWVWHFSDGIAIDPRTNTVYSSLRDYDSVYIMNGATGEGEYLEVAGRNPTGIGADPGAGAWVAMADDGSISYLENVIETIISSGPFGVSASTTATFTFSSSEGGTRFRCRLDGASWVSCASPKTYAGLNEDLHTFDVQAVDLADNPIGSAASRTWRVDLGPPETTITAAPGKVTNSTTATFSFVSNEAGSTFKCSIDNAGFVPCDAPVSYGVSANANHAFAVQAIDAAGSADPSPATHSWFVDTAPPDTALDPAAGPAPSSTSTTTQATFKFSSTTDLDATFECSLDGADWRACASPETVSLLADGSHEFGVRAIDPAGNVDATPASRRWRIDATGPVVTFTQGPDGPTNVADPLFAWDADEQVQAYQCRVDDAPFGPCSSPKRLTGLPEGPHVLGVQGTDVWGNVSAASAIRRFTVDLTAPETDITEGPEEGGFDSHTTTIFRFWAPTDPDATFECSRDGAPYSPCGSPKTYSSLGEDNHIFRVRAVDAAGNKDLSAAFRSWGIDTSAPSVRILRPIGGSVFSSDSGGGSGIPVIIGRVTVTAEARDDESGLSSFTFFVDGTQVPPTSSDPAGGRYTLEYAFTSCPVGGTPVPAAPCLHTIGVRAANGAGTNAGTSVQVLVIPT